MILRTLLPGPSGRKKAPVEPAAVSDKTEGELGQSTVYKAITYHVCCVGSYYCLEYFNIAHSK
jgi:hypothetical protein